VGLEKAPKVRTKAPRKLPKLTNEEKRKSAKKVLAKLPGGKKTVKKLTPEQKAKNKKLEKKRFIRQFGGVSRLFERNGMKINVEDRVKTYLSTPKNKKVPVATIQTSMSNLFSSADIPLSKKELAKNKTAVYTILNYYCRGNLVVAKKGIRTLTERFEFIKKCCKDFEEVDMTLGKHGLKFPKGYIEAYIKLPKGKGIPIKTIKANLAGIFKIAMKIWKINNSHIPEGILPLSRKYGKLPPRPGGAGYPPHKPLLGKGDKFSIYSALGFYCNGAERKGDKILKRLEEKQKYLEKIENVMRKDIRLKRFGHEGINRIFAALIQSGVPKSEVFDVFIKEFDAIKKLDEINMSELSNSMPNRTYMEFLVGAILARRGGKKEKADEFIKRKILIESTHIRNVRELESKKDWRTLKIAQEVADLQKYQEENPDVGFDKTILGHKKKITKLQLEKNTYESLLLLCDMTKFVATKYLEKKTTNPASEVTIANISAYMNAYKTSPFNDKKNLQDLKFFSADVKVPIPPALSIYHAIIAEKELIKLNGPSRMFDNSDLGKLFIECQDGFLKTGKLDKSTVEKQVMLDLLQNKASRIKERQDQVMKLAKSHETYFSALSANHKDINSLPPEKREEVNVRLIGYVSILNTVRKLDAKYYEICKDFKFTLMLGAPKGAKPEDVLRKVSSYKHSFKKGKDLTYKKVTYKLNNFVSYTRGYLEDANKTPSDSYREKILKVYGFLRLKGKLPKLNELAGSDILQPIIKAELSPTFDAIEKLYSKGGDVAEAQRKINAVGLKMQNDRKNLPETMMANSFDTCLGFYDNAITRLTRANKTIEKQRDHLKKLIDSDAIFKKYKNRPEIAKKITVAIKLTKKKLSEMEMNGKSLVSLDGIGRAMDARNKFKANRDNYIKHKFYEGMVTAGMLVVAVGTAMVGGSAFAALGTRLFARVASASLQKALITTFSMAGASAGGVVGARGFQSFAQYAGMADFGGYGKIWNRKRLKRDFAIGFLLSMGAVTAGRGLMAGLERGAVSKFGWVSRFSGKGLDRMKTVGKILSPDEWFQGKGALTNSSLKRYGMRVGGETVQEGFEEAMERVHPVAGFLASVGSCSRSPNIELALHGIRAGDIGIKTEGSNFVYTTTTGKEFARNIKREFNTKTDQTVETQVDPDGTVFLHLKKKYRNKKGKVISKRYSTIKIRPAQRGESLSPEAEIARIEGLEKDRSGVYKVQDAKTALKITRELKTRGFIVTKNEKGTLTVLKGEFTFELKISEQTAESIAKEKKGAMAYLKGNLASIRAKLKKPNIKKAFVAFMIKSQGNLAKFREKYPTLAKILPKDLLKLRLIPVPVVGMSCGVTFDLKSVSEVGMAGVAKDVALETPNKSVEYSEKLRNDIKEETDWMRECGYEKEAAVIANYGGKEYPTLEKRLEAAKKITAELDALNAAGIQFIYKHGKTLVEILRFRSKGGKSLKSLFEKYQKAQISRDTKTTNEIHDRLAKGFQIFFGRCTKQMIPKILQLGISRLPALKKSPTEVLREFETLSKETTLREQSDYEKSLNSAVEVLRGQPGIVHLNKNIETLIIPDLHARRSELVQILSKKGSDGKTNLEKMKNGQLQIVVLGDGMHAEGRAKTRWKQATSEVMTDPHGRSKSMDTEMVESLGVMKMIMELKTANPKMFHYLKGNHDNITDRSGGGDIPFGKYSMAGEGQMVKRWIQRNYGEAFLNKWAQFEQSLPIMAIGNNFVASHAEPGNFLLSSKGERRAIIDLNDINNRTPEAVEALTWSRTEKCGGNQADVILRMAGLDPARAKYIVGHSPTRGQKYMKQENGVIIINDAVDLKYARIKANGEFNPDTDIYDVGGKEVAEVAKPIDAVPRDKVDHQKVKNKNIDEYLGLRGESIDVVNPQGITEIILPGGVTLEIRPNRNYGYMIFNKADPMNQYKALRDGKYISMGRRHTYGRFNFPATVSREHLSITRVGDKITVTNLGTYGTKVKTK